MQQESCLVDSYVRFLFALSTNIGDLTRLLEMLSLDETTVINVMVLPTTIATIETTKIVEIVSSCDANGCSNRRRNRHEYADMFVPSFVGLFGRCARVVIVTS